MGWAQLNRSALIRIPRYNDGMTSAVRCELRCPDPSSNPYLAFAAMIATTMDGIENELTPPKPLNSINVYDLTPEEKIQLGITQLPGSLLEALEELDKDEVVKEALGADIYDTFRRAKLAEWDEYRMQVMDWEIDKYLETT